MTQDKLAFILRKHEKWINGDDDEGRCANLNNEDLNGIDLSETNLRCADLRETKLNEADLHGAILRDADLCGADLSEADLRRADLRDTDLQNAILCGADLDYSAWPLCEGSFEVKVDKRIFAQLAYHLCRVVVDDGECKAAQQMLAPIANQFHRVEECGEIVIEEDKQ